MHHWLGLALLVSRLLIIISELDDGESAVLLSSLLDCPQFAGSKATLASSYYATLLEYRNHLPCTL
jgi:hypothetical protein